jgi:hypothetical protein
MVVITFPDEETQRNALGFLVGRFSGKVLKTGEHLVPEAALDALAEKKFSFTVMGTASDEWFRERAAALRRESDLGESE